MQKQTGIKQRIAGLTSIILNPFLISLTLILLFSFTSTPSTSEAIKWVLISMAVSILPVSVIVIYLLRHGTLDTFFINVRQQRTRIYLLGCLCAITGCFILSYLQAPQVLVAGFTVALLTTIMFMLINLWWKISVHTGFIAASSVVLVMMYGWVAAATIALVPLTAWARIELKYHSLAQAVSGAVLATLIAVAVYYPIAIA
ncbi:hypothetical protein ACFLUL_03625 [Chloroflexota bacterium]